MAECSQPGTEPLGIARRFYAVVGAIVLATWAVLGTEVLSLFGAFAAVPIALFWLGSFALLLFVARRSGLIATDWGKQRQIKEVSQSVSPFDFTLLALIGLLLTTAF